MSSKIKIKEKEKEREKEEKLQRFALKPEPGPRGIWQNPLKPSALNLHWLGVADLVFATRVDGWSLANCRGAGVSKSFRVRGET